MTWLENLKRSVKDSLLYSEYFLNNQRVSYLKFVVSGHDRLKNPLDWKIEKLLDMWQEWRNVTEEKRSFSLVHRSQRWRKREKNT